MKTNANLTNFLYLLPAGLLGTLLFPGLVTAQTITTSGDQITYTGPSLSVVITGLPTPEGCNQTDGTRSIIAPVLPPRPPVPMRLINSYLNVLLAVFLRSAIGWISAVLKMVLIFPG